MSLFGDAHAVPQTRSPIRTPESSLTERHHNSLPRQLHENMADYWTNLSRDLQEKRLRERSQCSWQRNPRFPPDAACGAAAQNRCPLVTDDLGSWRCSMGILFLPRSAGKVCKIPFSTFIYQKLPKPS